MKYVVLFVGQLYKPFQTIKIWLSWHGGSGKVKICPRMAWIWLWSRPEAPKLVNEPWNGPKWFPQLPVIDLSPFPDLLKHYSLYILKNINYLILSKILISEISTLNNYHFQLSHFLNDFVIFLSIPYDGILRKITKPFKKWLSWPWKMSKVTCIFFRILG